MGVYFIYFCGGRGIQFLTEVEIFKHFQLSCKDYSSFNRNGNMVVLLSYILRINPQWLSILKVEFDKNKSFESMGVLFNHSAKMKSSPF